MVKSRTEKRGYLNAYISVQGEKAEKLVIRYVSYNWMAPNKCCGIFFVYWSSQVHLSITASKENVVVFFCHSYDYFIVCDNYNLHNFTYLLAGLQVSKTEVLTELH